jgi:DNA-binding MarR family transcriptional regulator
MVDLLLETGLINEETDPEDKRRKKLFSPTGGGEKKGSIENDSNDANDAGFSSFLGESLSTKSTLDTLVGLEDSS